MKVEPLGSSMKTLLIVNENIFRVYQYYLIITQGLTHRTANFASGQVTTSYPSDNIGINARVELLNSSFGQHLRVLPLLLLLWVRFDALGMQIAVQLHL